MQPPGWRDARPAPVAFEAGDTGVEAGRGCRPPGCSRVDVEQARMSATGPRAQHAGSVEELRDREFHRALHIAAWRLARAARDACSRSTTATRATRSDRRRLPRRRVAAGEHQRLLDCALKRDQAAQPCATLTRHVQGLAWRT